MSDKPCCVRCDCPLADTEPEYDFGVGPMCDICFEAYVDGWCNIPEGEEE